jgi:hypothetical protein
MNPILVAKLGSQNYGNDKENNDEETFHEGLGKGKWITGE